MANAMIALMDALGHPRFAVVGHDRGARVGYRLALDQPGTVTAASLTVVPTLDMWAGVTKAFAIAAYHWFMLAQPFDLPERLLASDPDALLDRELAKSAGAFRLDQRAIKAYQMAFHKPSVRHAMCEDYRAAASEDAEYDAADRAAGRKLICPVLVALARTPRRQGRDPRRCLAALGGRRPGPRRCGRAFLAGDIAQGGIGGVDAVPRVRRGVPLDRVAPEQPRMGRATEGTSTRLGGSAFLARDRSRCRADASGDCSDQHRMGRRAHRGP
jgi:hypothetical protein